MTKFLLQLICDPVTKEKLFVKDEHYDENGDIVSGVLTSPSGYAYPIINGIPRFVAHNNISHSVTSFGDQWNFFNFIDFHDHWLNHTVKNTFGSIEVFKDQIVVDCGGGSGSQSMWMLASGARHVIMLELSHSVDGAVKSNFNTHQFKNFDVIQCSIDAPPLLPASIKGIIICHNVIQHTPSVEKTAKELFNIVSPGGEFVFNCYRKYNEGLFRKIRFYGILLPLRSVLKRMPFFINLSYARLMGLLRLVPVLGTVLEKLYFLSSGDVPAKKGWAYIKQRYKATVLNTFDCFGSHEFQHYKSDTEIQSLLRDLQPDEHKIKNANQYFSVPPPLGCALRVFK